MQLKPIDYDLVSKKGIKGISGKVYKISDYICTERWVELKKFEQELYTSGGYDMLLKRVNKCFDYFDQMKFTDGIKELDKLRQGSYVDLQKQPPHMKICTLFLNYKGEDETRFSEKEMNEKIDDWRGYDCAGFFPLVLSYVTGSRENYLAFLEAQKKIQNTEV